MNEIMVGELSEFAEGGYRVLRVDAFEFGVFRQGDRLTAYENYCPHDGGPVCQGKVIPRVEEELAADQTSRGLRFSAAKNIVCPWHGWRWRGDGTNALIPYSKIGCKNNVRVRTYHNHDQSPAVDLRFRRQGRRHHR